MNDKAQIKSEKYLCPFCKSDEWYYFDDNDKHYSCVKCDGEVIYNDN